MIKAIASSNQPHATYVALEKEVDDTIGIKLFTLMEIDRERAVARRSYSNRPDAYPTSGEKPLESGTWSDNVQQNHQIFVANSIEDIADVFSDYALIQSLGCESCINIPIVIAGDVVGTLNCLHEAGHYTADKLALAESLKVTGALAFLMARHYRPGS